MAQICISADDRTMHKLLHIYKLDLIIFTKYVYYVRHVINNIHLTTKRAVTKACNHQTHYYSTDNYFMKEINTSGYLFKMFTF